MFTGIITNIAKVEELKYNKDKDLLFKISLKEKVKRKLEIGCSIACNGVCLTLIDKKISTKNTVLSFQVSQETLSKTNFKTLKIDDLINIEFSMRLGDEFGGHMVLGHVDNSIKIKSIKKIKDSHKFTFLANKSLIKFIVKKGSVTLNGVSLTVNEVKGNCFDVNLIKHTIDNTSFKIAKVGDLVNFEIDLITRVIYQNLKK